MKTIVKIFIIQVFILVFFSNFVFAQDSINLKNKGQHTVFVEFLGNSIIWYSLNYDYSYIIKNNHKIAFSMGFQYYPNFGRIEYNKTENTGFHFSLSPHLSYLYGKKHNLELGIVGLYLYDRDTQRTADIRQHVFTIIPRIGYRYQKPDGGIFWKIAWTPLIQPLPDKPTGFDKASATIFYFWGGVSIGYTFKNKK